MGNTFYFGWEVALMEAIQAHLGELGAKIASIVSMFGEETVLVLVLGFVYWCWDSKVGRIIGLNIVMGVTYNPLAKNIALRRRPYMDNPSIQCLRPVDAEASIYDIKAQGYSFPSGHSTNSTIAFGSIAYFFTPAGGTITGFSTNRYDVYMRKAKYQKLNVLCTTKFYLMPRQSATCKFKITTAKGVKTKPKVVHMPLLSAYRHAKQPK